MDIGDRLKDIREKKGISQQKLADGINALIGTEFKRTTISNYETDTSQPELQVLAAIVKVLGITSDELLGIGNGVSYAQLNAQPNAQLTVKEAKEKYTKRLGNDHVAQSAAPVPDHVVDTSGRKLIPILDIKAAAGVTGIINPDFITAEDVIMLPAHMIKSGVHTCIRIKGPSMAPTMQDGSYAAIRYIDRGDWANQRSELVYFVVDTDGKAYIKRLKNRLGSGEKGFIVCMSDNPDKVSHPNFNLHLEEIAHLWIVEWYLSAKIPNIHDTYFSRVSNLEDKVDLLDELVRTMQKQLK